MRCSSFPFASFFLSSTETPAETLIKTSDRRYIANQIQKLSTEFNTTGATKAYLTKLVDLLILSKARMIRLRLTKDSHDSFTFQESLIDDMLRLQPGSNVKIQHDLKIYMRGSNPKYCAHNVCELYKMYARSKPLINLENIPHSQNIKNRLAVQNTILTEHYDKKSSSTHEDNENYSAYCRTR